MGIERDYHLEWKIFSGRIVGSKHPHPQDFISTYIKRSESIICVAMSDGASSASNAEIGARTIVNGLISKIFKNREGQGVLEDLLNFTKDEIRSYFYKSIMASLNEEIQKLQNLQSAKDTCSLQSMASTMMCFFTDGDKYYALGIGDGLIGKCGKDGVEIILEPEHLMYVNQTHYITDNDAFNNIRVMSGKYDQDSSYVMMTDGSCSCLYSKRKKIFAPLLYKFCNIVNNYPRAIGNKYIHTSMKTLFPKRTDDDCALAIITCKRK